ncbi:MAG: MFS transporter [Actinomycetota bacterium]
MVASRSTSQRGGPFRRLVYPLAASVGVSFGAILYGTSVLITSQAAGAEFSIGLLSSGFSGSVLTGAAVAVPVGRRADRHGIRAIVGVGGLLVGLGFAAFAASTASWQVLAAWWLLIGPGSAMVLFDPAFVAIQQWFDPRDRNRAAGTLTVITGLAGPVFVPGTTAAVAAIGWRPTAVLLGGVVSAIAAVTAGLALRVAPRPEPGPERSLKPTGRLPPGFIPLTGAIVAGLAAVEAIQVHRIARFEITGFDTGTLAFWAAAASLLSLPGRFLLPRLANRFSSPWLLLAVTGLLVPSFALAIRGTTPAEMVGHFVIFGLLFGAVIPLRAVVMSDWFSGPRFGVLMGVQAVAIAGGRSGGPAVVGWAADSPGGYPLGMALLTGLLAISAGLLVLAVRRRGGVFTGQ